MAGRTQTGENTISDLKQAQFHTLTTDHLGTVQMATNEAGQVTWRVQSEAFGKTTPDEQNQITMNLRFPGQYFDEETGMHYNDYRDYNPSIGRYIQRDPIELRGGVNVYGYVNGNSLRNIDAFGLVDWGRIFDEIIVPTIVGAVDSLTSPVFGGTRKAREWFGVGNYGTSEKFKQCMKECIDKTYGTAHEAAEIFNPLSLPELGGEALNKKSIPKAEKRIRWRDLDDRWGGKEKAAKMRKTVGAGKAVGNVSSGAGAAGTGFIMGTDAYCSIQCRGASSCGN